MEEASRNRRKNNWFKKENNELQKTKKGKEKRSTCTEKIKAKEDKATAKAATRNSSEWQDPKFPHRRLWFGQVKCHSCLKKGSANFQVGESVTSSTANNRKNKIFNENKVVSPV